MKTTRDALWKGRLILEQPAKGEGYRFNIDPVLLAGFASPAGHAMELGAGCGVLGLLLLANTRAERVTAVEVQESLAMLARANGNANDVSNRYTVEFGDHRTLRLPSVDAVLFNPPYFRAAASRASPSPGRDAGRRELNGTLADFVATAARCVTPTGYVAAIVRCERDAELRELLTAKGLSHHRVRRVHAREGEAAGHVLVEARAPGHALNTAAGAASRASSRAPSPESSPPSGELTHEEPPLIVHVGDGRELSDEVRAWVDGP